MAGERSEQASPQRREKARREGDLLHSRELCSAAATLVGVMLLGIAAPRFLDRWGTGLAQFLDYGREAAWEPSMLEATLRSILQLSLRVLAPVSLVAAGVCSAALGAGILQTGGVQIHVGSVGFRLDRINPLSNLKNLFSLRSAARLGKSMIPATALGIFAVQRMARLSEMPPFSTARLMALRNEVYGLLLAAAWLLFAWALVDYVVEWRSREQRLRMSRQEMREEYKESEGNPQIRARIRNLQRQARRRRMQADVSKAAVVVTNPTHYAVALAFDFETMEAPKVLAKGRNLLAEEIKQQARWAGIPIHENAPLARSLYRSVEPGEGIPVALYAAVASILAFLYRQRVEEELRARRSRNAPTQGAEVGRPGPNEESYAGASDRRSSPGVDGVSEGTRRGTGKQRASGPARTRESQASPQQAAKGKSERRSNSEHARLAQNQPPPAQLPSPAEEE